MDKSKVPHFYGPPCRCGLPKQRRSAEYPRNCFRSNCRDIADHSGHRNRQSKLWSVYTIPQTSSKLPAHVFKIHVLMLDVCWIV